MQWKMSVLISAFNFVPILNANEGFLSFKTTSRQNFPYFVDWKEAEFITDWFNCIQLCWEWVKLYNFHDCIYLKNV